MGEFKIGDWVLDNEDNLFQVYRVRDDEIVLVDEPFYVPTKDFRLWIPQEGEWCWFYDANKMYRGYLARYLRFCSDSESEVADDDSEWDYVEPFIGNLPSFIKGR